MKKYLINFKSVEPNFSKEESGIKNNTIRTLDKNDDRLQIIKNYIAGECELNIQITNENTNKNFTREVKDITLYKSLYIITWAHEKVKNVKNNTNKK